MIKTEANIKSRIKEMLNFSVWRITGYFIIYSVLGFIVETIFGIITKGVIESRQSFLYGPFCGIYGIGAIIMIICLQPFKNKSSNKLFWGGFLVGSIVEYIISLIGESIFHVIWWDYSDMPLNLNGRVCFYFSIFWGLLGIYLISYINPKVDLLIDWIKKRISIKALKIMEISVLIFLIFDFLITAYALKLFFIRVVKENQINIGNKVKIESEYKKIYNDEKKSKMIYKFFGDEKMIKTFPNLKLQDDEGNIVYFDSFFSEIQPYYYRVSDVPIKTRIKQKIDKLEN